MEDGAVGRQRAGALLQACAGAWGAQIRPGDLLARYGGEEFVIVLPDCGVTDAVQVLERVRAMLAQRLENATVPSYTVSPECGVSNVGARRAARTER